MQIHIFCILVTFKSHRLWSKSEIEYIEYIIYFYQVPPAVVLLWE